MPSVAIVGGHGQVALRLTRILAPTHDITSIIRKPEHIPALQSISPGISPLLLSIEDSPVADFTQAFRGKDVVVFAAGAGGKGGPERTTQVDYEGAVKVMDAIEGVEEGQRPRLVLLSSIDVRDPEKMPEHYNEEDRQLSHAMRAAIGHYFQCKYEADKNLAQRTAFKWTIVRPNGLLDTPGTGRVSIGRTHTKPSIPRDDVAAVLAQLVDREDAAGLAMDVIGGSTPISEALDAFVQKGETDFLG
ncbi:NAD(P)-binding protein [Auriscalpium vulgare]|uniref:NAD(P)-binding protein n=1 Tax=Auriscalpium vulgare TaxID=40419 RepID=A0ACB8RGE5_9AGAM|nr:NAD(P)-binding protein [Auriscalpium vulgare]